MDLFLNISIFAEPGFWAATILMVGCMLTIAGLLHWWAA
jgi:hypothetical protein